MSSESDEEDFTLYGTPLEPINQDEVPKKRALTVGDQVAKDKHGRRRFHGAFTGGFSAGFFNTVGSLEGWKPSQFTSSRSARTKTQLQSAEDFMDDEDMGEFGIAPKSLQPRNDYNQASDSLSRKRSLMQFSDGPIPGIPVLKTLVEPVRETIGIKLLMKMGWKSGQGVGPRLSKTEKSASKKSQKQVRIYGCTLPPTQGEQSDTRNGDTSEEEEDDILESITFAPDDYEPYVVKPKDNCFGLGYSGLDRRPVLSSHINLFGPAGPSLIMEEKKKKVSIRGQAFGVGAFENEDDDIYANEDMSQYDFALDTPKMMAEKRLVQERNSRLALPSSSTEVLEGFVVVSQRVMQKIYPPPPLPQGFRPLHHTKCSRFSAAPESRVVNQPARLTANERAVLINTDHPQRDVPSTQENKVLPESVEVERTTGTFRPFVADPEKQIRYEQFLTLSKLNQTDKLKRLQPLNMTEWEAERERAEFEQAARLYRPLSAAVSDRFVSASQPDDATDPLAPVARTAGVDQDVVNAAKLKMFGRLTRKIGEWQPHSTLCKRFNIPPPGRSSNTTAIKTSRPKFSIFNFLDAAPFNCPVSTAPAESTNVTTSLDKTSTTPIPALSSDSSDLEKNTQDTRTKSDEDEKLTTITNKMDLYQAIFLSSSDESEGDEEKQTSNIPSQTVSEKVIERKESPPRGIFANLESKASTVESLEKTAREANILRNTSPPRGIFANLDSINAMYKKTSASTLPTTEVKDITMSLSQGAILKDNTDKEETRLSSEIDQQSKSNTISSLDNCSVYGPALPTKIQHKQTKTNCLEKESSSESEEWVEREDQSNSSSVRNITRKKHTKKSHRKSKKRKEKKHKHKNKKK